jgi:hypothetical protein
MRNVKSGSKVTTNTDNSVHSRNRRFLFKCVHWSYIQTQLLVERLCLGLS